MGKRTLTEKENVLRVLQKTGTPEWVPINNDCFCVVSPSVDRDRPLPGCNGKDWFGVSWVWDENCLGFAPDLHKPYLLEDITQWRDIVTFPDLDTIDWEAAAARDSADVDRENYLVYTITVSGCFERSHHLLGLDNAFMAMYDHPLEFKALIDALADFKVDFYNRMLTWYKPDIAIGMDDLGSATSPLISLDMYRTFLKPAHTRIGEVMRSHDCYYLYHSCGYMETFIDDLIDMGAQILHPIQPCNDHKTIAKTYSDKLVFEVGASNAMNLESSTDEEIRAEVRRVIDEFAPYKSLVLTIMSSNAATADKMQVALDEAREYGGSFYS